jgi:hypothetical protein
MYANVDASFTLHDDLPSQIGMIILVGDATVYRSRKKQKCMSMNPAGTE